MSRRFPVAYLAEPSSELAGRVRGESGRRMVSPVDCGPVDAAFAAYTPVGYEPNYAYPLLVWFHDAGEDERVLNRLAPEISDRNFVGLSLRGERRFSSGYDWSDRSASRAQRLVSTIRRIRREHHVHTERIVLSGRGTGALAAAELFFSNPEWFGGLALFDAVPTACSTLRHVPDLHDKPVLLDLQIELLGRGRDAAGRLSAAGLDVTIRHSGQKTMNGERLRHLNLWLMYRVCGVAV